MGRKCFVPYCRSGYNSCNDSVTLFSCPNDPEGMRKWADAVARLDRPLRPSDCICEKHFKEEDIIRYWRAFDKNGEEVMKVAYQRVRLRNGAVPCYFPDSPQKGFSRKKRRLTSNSDVKLKRERRKESNKYSLKVVESQNETGDFFDNETDYSNNLSVGEETVEGFDPIYDSCDDHDDKCSDCPDERRECTSEIEYNDLLTRARLFADLWEDSQILRLPSKSWAIFHLEGNCGRKIVITQMGLADVGAPSPVKQVCLDEEMNVELYLKTNKLHCEEMNVNLPKMCKISDVSSFIQSVDGLLDWD